MFPYIINQQIKFKKEMKKLFLILLSGSVLLGFTGCLDDGDSASYYEGPAMVTYENQNPMLKLAGETTLSVPGLSDTLKTGDCLWSYFSTENNIVSGLAYQKLGVDTVFESSGDMKDDYNDAIKSAAVYEATIDSVLFFVFSQKELSQSDLKSTGITESSPYGNAYTYEIMYNTDSIIQADGKEIPKLYIKSKKINASSSSLKSRFAFNMNEFVSKYSDSETGQVPLYLHFKIGTDSEGNDVYQKFQNYPIKWKP